jgi:alpha-galactosidase
LKERDNQTGRVVPDPKLYPSGFANISDDLEALGFHFGLYSDSGTLHCGGGAPGGLGHEEVDAQAYADWGVTYLKYDNCFADTCTEFGCGNAANDTIYRYTAMSKGARKPVSFAPFSTKNDQFAETTGTGQTQGTLKKAMRFAALNNTHGRHGPILFSMCEWGVADPAEWGPAVSNMWRTTADISDVWTYMCELADLTAEWFDHAGPGGWCEKRICCAAYATNDHSAKTGSGQA